ncbi:MAG: UDP-N-acetylmuramyl-tripeptide synthetase [Candidatus Daviesbacteria bacterium GW2011_GWA2_38_24]|uniref:UDP-N-acetylmuramyl-tripeptide synthetase n=1 Tax=Candidatus Daviesbacteria bacterium GW2011_GWA2_38_24 TaxID=1618422 RepID=A0A0G0JVQ5_9BACT|nr:MAG: UDP-N-acetylmuramyl-tripeptide synthetase [Candidatus Daviesbacteria bacterium GW2011_GWA2_38_24]KKQ80536.1 MAG: UDP-N-acetylmuramyl-tripeptide synthetase [Candidatus Daviesbacteria bacterium GW2011_GWA1_38_7]
MIPNKLVNVGKHLPTAVVANIQYGFPSKKIKVIGVTGTDGKTTTVNMIYQILKKSNKKVSMISTINAVIGKQVFDTGLHVTSPSSALLQKLIKQSVENGDEYLILEVTSHALDQFRTWGIKFDIGVITNVTHEHLDYHKTFDNYLNAKIKLLKNTKLAIINKDDKNFEKIESSLNTKIFEFSLEKDADLNLRGLALNLKILGSYNFQNALAAAAVAINLGIDKETIKKALENFTSLSGRMEEIKNNKDIRVIVDFAHTPNALENALTTLRKETKGKLIAVFGAAAERDIAKRPVMGKIASRLADIVVLTDEDPRFEDSLKIINEIAAGCLTKGAKIDKSLFKEPNRKKAIEFAISLANKGDSVGIFGKGHEQSMNYKGEELPWSDVTVVKEILR